MAKFQLNGWKKIIASFVFGAAIPGLIAWGAMQNQINNNKDRIKAKVDKEVYEEYKDSVKMELQRLNRIAEKIYDEIKK